MSNEQVSLLGILFTGISFAIFLAKDNRASRSLFAKLICTSIFLIVGGIFLSEIDSPQLFGFFVEIKNFERQLRKNEALFQSLQESIGNLKANRILKRMDDKAYKTAVSRMNDEADRLKTEITNLRLKLRGEAEKK